MFRSISLVLVLCMAAASSGEQPAEVSSDAKVNQAQEILQKAAAAMHEVKFARYAGTYKGTDWVKQYVPDVQGTAIIGEPSRLEVERFQCDAKVIPIGGDKAVHIVAGCDGETYYVIDGDNKKVYADIDPAVMGSRERDPRPMLFKEFIAEKPLEKELEAENLKIEDDISCGGELCWQIRIVVSESRETLLCIAKSDFLPRKVTRIYRNGQGVEGTTELVLDHLRVEKKGDSAAFKLVVPQGFTQTDDFAP